ncbi:MAG: microcin C transport system permease protein [Glaciecola sp.]|jgi:microcin C transport system permease protein
MAAYFARRLLLLIPTFLGITMLVFGVTRFVPGGPMDQAELSAQMGSSSGEGGGGKASGHGGSNMDPRALNSLKKYYHFDWPEWKQYLQFLGPLNLGERGVFGDTITEAELITWEADPDKELEEGDSVLRMRMTGIQSTEKDAPSATVVSERIYMPEAGRLVRWLAKGGDKLQVDAPLFEYQVAGAPEVSTFLVPDLWTKKSAGILAGDLGTSYKFEVPVTELIVARFPISLRFGLTGFLLAYLICIPLGIIKAVRHSSRFDLVSSTLIFIGYSVPGWALGAVLLVTFGGGSFWDVFPLGDIHSSNYDNLSALEKLKESIHHMVLPVIAYSIGSFAVLTVLMKNSLMENLGQDYVRTAFAKGLSERRVIMVHALRNSLIPICTGLGHALGLVMAGSYLIEKVFNINGLGLLGFESIIGRDYTVVMGVLVINTLLMLIGNILSDILYVLVDPRIRFS